jgi:hypothetical protein
MLAFLATLLSLGIVGAVVVAPYVLLYRLGRDRPRRWSSSWRQRTCSLRAVSCMVHWY